MAFKEADGPSQQFELDNNDSRNDFDPYKLLVVFKQSIPAIALVMLLSFAGVFLFLRYSKPIFQSNAVFKLQSNNRTKSLGFSTSMAGMEDEESVALAGEIEIIKSPIIRDKVTKYLNLGISYFVYGNILFEEKFNDSPIKVVYIDDAISLLYDTPIDIQIVDAENFKLEIPRKDYSGNFKFGEICKTPYLNIVLSLTNQYKAFNNNQKMFILFNSKSMLAKQFQEDLFVDISNIDAKTLTISYKDHNPIKAYQILKSIDSIYLDQTLQLKIKSYDQAIDFLNKSISNAEKNLLDAENDFESFMRNSKTMDVRADYTKYNKLEDDVEKQKTDLKLQADLLFDLKEIVLNNSSLKDFIPSLPKIDNDQLVKAISSLNQLNQEKERLLLSQNTNTFAFQTKQVSIQKTKEGVLNLISQNEKIVQKQIHELNKQTYEIESVKLTLPGKETEMSRLKRHYNLYDKFYVLLMEKMVEQSISRAGVTGNFVELSEPSINIIPIYPKRNLLFMIGLGLGIVLSICFVIIRYLLYDTITTLAELEKSIQATIIGSVPEYNKEVMLYSQLVVDKSPKSAVSESIRSIRTNLEFIIPNKERRILSITSTISGEGKTFVAVNLAGVIAMSNQKVVILDLDMRKPKIHLAFDAENNNGISTILIGKNTVEQCIQHTSIKNLDFITAGPLPPNPSELILLKEFDKLIEDLQYIYDVVIIDTPPVGLVTDGILIMKKVDVPLYVVRINYSKFAVANEIKRTINRGGYHKLCVIANAVPMSKGYGYGYGYGYYEGEGSDKSKNWFSKFFNKA
jgi:tyrosine-protein kinase Etk/Wzc